MRPPPWLKVNEAVAVRSPPSKVTRDERAEDSHKLASDPVLIEPGGWGESKPQPGDGSVDAIGTRDLLPLWRVLVS